MIYLDNAATTRIHYGALDAMRPFLEVFYGNAGSLHSVGREAYNAVQNARKQVADFIGALPEQIIFTSGGTEANNMIANFASHLGMNFVMSSVEHDSIIESVKLNHIERDNSACFCHVHSDGIVDLDTLEFILKNANCSSFVSIMHTNNELGTINPIKKIGQLCSEYHASFHTDCVQAAGFTELDVNEFNCDFMTISSHKIHGPKGVGALYVRHPNYFRPLICGGKAQEFGLRGGTENVAGIVGFGKACEIAQNNMDKSRSTINQCVMAFKETLDSEMSSVGLGDIIHYNSVAGKIINVRFDRIRSEALIMMLDSQGVCVSAGSACNASDGKPSHVLKAIGLTDDEARRSIRVSFSRMNTVEESAKAAQIVASCVNALKED